jgi:hypothetical protein
MKKPTEILIFKDLQWSKVKYSSDLPFFLERDTQPLMGAGCINQPQAALISA